MPLRDNARDYYSYLIENNQRESDNERTHNIRRCKNRSEYEHRYVDIPPIFLQGIYLDESRVNGKGKYNGKFKRYSQYVCFF